MNLMICADDFSQNPEIDHAIIHLIKINRLSATSCMVNSPYWASSAKLITEDIRNKADIGLHLDFTLFGYGYSHTMLTLLSVLHCLPKRLIQRSIEQQLDQFEEKLGTKPDYVDGHQHVHQLPQIRQALLTILKKRYAHQLPWLRIAKPNSKSGLKGLIIKLLGATALAREANAMGFQCSNTLLGVYDFSGNVNDYKKRLTDWVMQVENSTGTPVLMCHPSIDRVDWQDDPIYPARVNEFSVLSSNAFNVIFNTINMVKKP